MTGKKQESNGISMYFWGIPTAFAIGMLVGYLVWGRELGTTQAELQQLKDAVSQVASANAAQTAQAAQPVQRYDVPLDDDPVLGPEDAPITIVEFSDYECPYCQMWHNQVLGPLMDAFPGQIRFVYRDLPLNSHPNAVPAAEAANCAGEQDKYFEYQEKLFSGAYGLSPEAYTQYAAELGLNLTDFQACYDSHKYTDEVMADQKWAMDIGIRSTPTFFVNGIPLVGAQGLDVFHNVISQELAGLIP